MNNEFNQKLNSKQLAISTGLSYIGEEIASFYHDGICIINDERIKTKGNLLGHIAREIDGGFRDLFKTKESKIICNECAQEIRNNNYKDSIAKTLGVDLSDPFVKNWHSVVKNFHKYGHRHGAWREVRDYQEMIQLWENYEDVLFYLIGSFFNFVKRFDRILEYDTPTEEQIGLIKNSVKEQAFRKYFFSKINNKKWLKPLNEAGFFQIENHPKNEDFAPYTPYWDVLEYLKKVSEECQDNEDLFSEIKSIIDPIIEAADSLSNYRTDFYMTQIISTLPIRMIEDKYFDFIKHALDRKSSLVPSAIQRKFIKRLLECKSKEKVLNLLKVILGFTVEKKDVLNIGINESYSILGDYELSEIIEDYKNDIIALCGNEMIFIIADIMKQVITINSSAFNHIWIPTIADHPQTIFRDKYECQIVYLLRDTLISLISDELMPIVQKLLNEEHNIFKRIAIHTINKRYDDLNVLFWDIDWNPVDDLLKQEVYQLLKSNVKKFTTTQLSQIFSWIETSNYYTNDDNTDEEKKNKFTAYAKKEWYSSLLDSDNPEVTKKYQMYNEINPAELDHPGFNSWIGEFEESSSPITPEKINEMSIENLIPFFEEYKSKGGWLNHTINTQGLEKALKQAVVLEPMRYLNNIDKFILLDINYQYNIISGFKDALEKSRKSITNNDLLFKYLSLIINDTIVKNSGDNELFDIKSDLLKVSGWLIEDILRSDEIVLSEHDFDQIENLIIKYNLITKPKKTDTLPKDGTDFISLVLNSPKGIAYNNLVLYSLKYGRLKLENSDVKWKKSIKTIFDETLKNNSKHNLEFFIILGDFLNNLCWLDFNWVKDNIDLIFPEDQIFWQASFVAYLYQSNKVFKDVFYMLKNTNNYSRALENDLTGIHANDQLVRHILISYISSWEDITDNNSLIQKLFKNKGIIYFRTIATFIWSSREFFNTPDKQQRIKKLWDEVIKNYEEMISQKSQDEINLINEGMTAFLDWLLIFDYIDDEILELIEKTIKYSKLNFKTRLLIKHMNLFINSQPDVVGKIFITLIETGNIPTYQDDEVKILVEKLYELNQKKYADFICNKYGEEGFYFLRDTYYVNNPLQT